MVAGRSGELLGARWEAVDEGDELDVEMGLAGSCVWTSAVNEIGDERVAVIATEGRAMS